MRSVYVLQGLFLAPFKGLKGRSALCDKFSLYTSYNFKCSGFSCKKPVLTPENMSFSFRRRRSLGGAVDARGHPVYDKLQRVISPTASCQGSTCNNKVEKMTTAESSKAAEQLQHHSGSLGELREFVQALQGGTSSTEIMEMYAAKQARPRHRRRFSVDLGEVREFIALMEMRVSIDDSNSLAEQPRVQKSNHNEASC